MSSTSGAYFDPSVVPRFLGNLPTDFASQVIDMGAYTQATAFGAAVRPFGLFGCRSGIYDAALREIQERGAKDVSLRSWLAASEWVDAAAPFPGETFRRGAPGRFGTNYPEILMARHGWVVDVTQPGEDGANFGRWPRPMIPREVPGLPRSFLVKTHKQEDKI